MRGDGVLRLIDSIYALIKQARRLPRQYRESMVLVLEDWEAQFQIWLLHPEKLSEDEGVQRGIVLVLERLLEK